MSLAPERRCLVVRGGWEGHHPAESTERFIPFLKSKGYAVEVSETLDSYLDADQLDATDLVVQCWTMGEITDEQVDGLRKAVAAGTGLAGWHGGIVDAFRSSAEYLQLTGGQFATHPGGIVDHEVTVRSERSEHPIVAGLDCWQQRTEQYWILTDAMNDVLATTRILGGDGAEWNQDMVFPTVWTRQWGLGRVFVSTIGHSPTDLDVPQVRTLTERGLLWASR
ncbi:ThuA domain-containing protein [Pedococcus sp. 5OH_020]|uniref:ThuA domain-containing protein n=1 Tax=Pedococcus sp. 5OH_020 TaxID=2989814 RepID=UPI0022E9A2E1|nr:ThuA domain-containing protein [Pedococcus sp. 5OH_020]